MISSSSIVVDNNSSSVPAEMKVMAEKVSPMTLPFNTVPQGDIDAALRALEEVGCERIAAAIETAAQSTDEIEKRKIGKILLNLQHCMDSMRANLQRATNVINDDDYEAQFRRSAHVDVDWDLYDTGSHESTSSSEQEEDTDYDSETERELYLDREALARVKDLRSKVRQKSERIGKMRYKIPKQTARLIQSEIELFDSYRNEAQKVTNTPTKNLFSALEHAEETTSGNNTSNETSICKTVSLDSTTSEAIRDMETSLQELATLLKTVRDKLPEEVDSFLSTIEAVDAYVKKVTNAENLNELGEFVPFNPVEKAMFSPETRRLPSLNGGIEDVANNDLSSPQSKFLMYLQV